MRLAAAFKSLRGEKRKEEEKRTKISQEPPVPSFLWTDGPEGPQRKVRDHKSRSSNGQVWGLRSELLERRRSCPVMAPCG